jgi:hypothetical protein
MSDPAEIFLQPECCASPDTGRMWCDHDAPEDCDDGKPWARYVLADQARLVPKSSDQRPQYGEPILVAIKDVWQHVTYILDGEDETEDWVEPYHFDHDDNCKAFWRDVTAWIPMRDFGAMIAAAQEDTQ